MKLVEITDICQGYDFQVFDKAETVIAINAKGCANYTRKQLDSLIDFVKTPQIGAAGLIYCKYNYDGSSKSTVDKFFNESVRKKWANKTKCENGDLLLIMSGETDKTRKALGALRLHLGEILNLRKPNVFAPLWVIDFPLLEWSEENNRFHAMHHPFTAPKIEDLEKLNTDSKLTDWIKKKIGK